MPVIRVISGLSKSAMEINISMARMCFHMLYNFICVPIKNMPLYLGPQVRYEASDFSTQIRNYVHFGVQGDPCTG